MYSYTGTFKQQNDGTRLLEVNEFSYAGKLYKMSDPIKFAISDRPEEGGWIYVQDDSVGVRIGGDDIEKALERAFMMVVDQFEDFAYTTNPIAKGAKQLRERFKNWEVWRIDQQAQ